MGKESSIYLITIHASSTPLLTMVTALCAEKKNIFILVLLLPAVNSYVDMKFIPVLKPTVFFFKVALLSLSHIDYEIGPKIHLDCRRATRNVERKLLLAKVAGGVVQEERTGLNSLTLPGPVNGMENLPNSTIPVWDHWQMSWPP